MTLVLTRTGTTSNYTGTWQATLGGRNNAGTITVARSVPGSLATLNFQLVNGDPDCGNILAIDLLANFTDNAISNNNYAITWARQACVTPLRLFETGNYTLARQ